MARIGRCQSLGTSLRARSWRSAALVLVAVAVVATFLLMTRTAASAGLEGVEISMLIGGRQFFPYDEIADVLFVGKTVHLVLRSGERIAVARNAMLHGSGLAPLVERIREGAVGQRRNPDSPIAALARGNRNLSGWLRDLRGAATPGMGNYRKSAITSDALWRVLEDPSADAATRAAAAVALGNTTDASRRTRIASVATTVASPRLRVALETIGSGTDRDELLEEMLEDVELESARSARIGGDES
jgi:hypothetical protein